MCVRVCVCYKSTVSIMLTFIGTLAYGADVLSSSVYEPHEWIHVRFAAIAS